MFRTELIAVAAYVAGAIIAVAATLLLSYVGSLLS
jgi:hypothetical protein